MRSESGLLLLPIVLPFSTPALAVTTDSQIWTTAAATVKLSDKWQLSEEVTARFSHNRNGLYEIENNLLLGYQLSKTVTVWAGYTHDPQYSGGHFTVMEHRAREQVTFSKIAQFAGGSLDARMRVEERWREGIDGTGWRLRPYVKFTRPFNRGGKTALVISHESFFNLSQTSFQKQSGYDRMRNLIAVSMPIGKKLKLEVGYLNQYAFVRGGPDTMDHVASVSISL